MKLPGSQIVAANIDSFCCTARLQLWSVMAEVVNDLFDTCTWLGDYHEALEDFDAKTVEVKSKLRYGAGQWEAKVLGEGTGPVRILLPIRERTCADLVFDAKDFSFPSFANSLKRLSLCEQLRRWCSEVHSAWV